MLIVNVENPNRKHYEPLNHYRDCFQNKTVSIGKHNTFVQTVQMVLNLKSLGMNIMNYCRLKDSVRVEMPTKNPIVKYKDGQYQFKVPFVIYADFESILVPLSGHLTIWKCLQLEE